MMTKDKFFSAISEENADIVEKALSDGFDVNTLAEDENGTALNRMVSRGNISICKILIKNGANLESCTKYGMTPLISAIICLRTCGKEKKPDYLEIIEMLLIDGAKPTYIDKKGEEKFAYLLVDGLARRQIHDIFVNLGIVEKSKEEIMAWKKSEQASVLPVKQEIQEPQEERVFKKSYLPQPSFLDTVFSIFGFSGNGEPELEGVRPLISGPKLKKE